MAAGQRWDGNREVSPHPMQDGRRTPLKQLVRKLGIGDYDRPSEFHHQVFVPKTVRIPMQQHVGEPANPVVRKGQHVSEGALIADVPEDKLGAPIHASISGVVREVGEFVVIERGT